MSDAVKAIDIILEHFELKDFEGIGYEGSTPYQILISTILSQQTTERNSRKASEMLFSELPTPQDVYEADPSKIEQLVFSSGYYRQKTRCIKNVTKVIVEDYDGTVPDDPNELMKLPGVGKKTAACVMRYAFGKPSVIVDTHINRVSQRLGISDSKRPEDTQKAIMEKIPQDRWDDLDIAFICLGRKYCRPKDPNCAECPVSSFCCSCSNKNTL
jgi:endonuclease-3